MCLATDEPGSNGRVATNGALMFTIDMLPANLRADFSAWKATRKREDRAFACEMRGAEKGGALVAFCPIRPSAWDLTIAPTSPADPARWRLDCSPAEWREAVEERAEARRARAEELAMAFISRREAKAEKRREEREREKAARALARAEARVAAIRERRLRQLERDVKRFGG